MPAYLEVALLAARAGAAAIGGSFPRHAAPDFKGAVDPVTEADHRSEKAILEVLAEHRPGDATLSEESGGQGWERGRVWIADPLDGTVNFVHGLPHISVSVALWEDGHPKVGVVVDVTRGEEFTAQRSGGTHVDGARVSVSPQADLAQALMVTGFPYDRQERARVYTDVLARVLSRVQGVRRLGSAALDLCWVACGRFEGYWEHSLEAWDAAAGVLLVEEAGGVVTGYENVPFRLGEGGIVASNGLLHAELVEAVGSRG